MDATDPQTETTNLERQPAAAAGSADVPPAPPERIGRYRIERLLGKGGFGLVYLAFDDQLSRHVAVKVPHAKMISRPEDAEAYLIEARTVALLDHPNIVPVYDAGTATDFPCYIVSKYVEGSCLKEEIDRYAAQYQRIAELVASIAEALQHAHKQGLVHRDIKPGNILLDRSGRPYVVDFGLALREENVGKGPKYAGTPAYMSPEQARGEGHRVDGRSDIFSLGVVLYELLTSRKPFRGDSHTEILEQVTQSDPRPMRQFDEHIPRELERICLKAMAKRASERYTSAYELAEDLRHYQRGPVASAWSASTTANPEPIGVAHPGSVTMLDSLPPRGGSVAGRSDPGSHPFRIVPKGLRSFDAHDSDFFLELLPGPRDREGLPDCLRFWKTRIEEVDADESFPVGLIYGPSGCGKSSLVKAGLMPRLSDRIIVVYVEASPEDTETRLLQLLRKRCPQLSREAGLKASLSALRCGHGLPTGKKLLIVIDQFEQWLHAHADQTNAELTQALRQCDGGRVQSILMVRDDFWLAVSRFLRELEVPVVEGRNSALVDLFDPDHARKVLAAFGRAFGRLPEFSSEYSKEQREFLDQAVEGLAEDGKVISVRLALFAEMMKARPWLPATLRAMGGTRGVGVAFLEETFSAAAALPERRLHQQAARAVLRALLPESGANIKGQTRSRQELRAVSGYESRPDDFAALLRILDSELRLITPAEDSWSGDPRSVGSDEPDRSAAGVGLPGSQVFQLTHDYLVPALREWLTGKQRETRQGRAELRLAERAGTWAQKRESRFLPSAAEYFSIRLLTDRRAWTEPQRAMMRAARSHHLRNLTLAAVALAVGFLAAIEFRGRSRAAAIVAGLRSAQADAVPVLLREMSPYRRWTVPQLRKSLEAAVVTSNKDHGQGPTTTGLDGSYSELLYRVALYRDDASQAKPVLDLVLRNDWDPALVGIVGDALRPLPAESAAAVIDTMRDATAPATQRFRAGLLLARLEISDASLTTDDSQFLARQLIGANPELQPRLRQILTPWRDRLLDELERAATAAAWLLRRWGQIDTARRNAQRHVPFDPRRDWFTLELKPHSTANGTVGNAPFYMTFVVVPPGETTIGSRDSEADRDAAETPHRTRITRRFAILDREVTRGEFESFGTNLQGYQQQSVTLEHPMVGPNWYDCVRFCRWLGQTAGLDESRQPYPDPDNLDPAILPRDVGPDGSSFPRDWPLRTDAAGFRLPTEAEWETACRAGSATRYSFGSDSTMLDRYGWFSENARNQLRLPQQLRPNAYGLFDMHGSLFEWCHDWYGAYANDDVENPIGPPRGAYRVNRGGGWNRPAANCRSATRNASQPVDRNQALGFRVVYLIPDGEQ
jgi:serine/threonine protein kinase/formylglycine-generating enzyme required for sulfatase activity/energy-coupling factor transporter ATP-binding protein EcfA2